MISKDGVISSFGESCSYGLNRISKFLLKKAGSHDVQTSRVDIGYTETGKLKPQPHCPTIKLS